MKKLLTVVLAALLMIGVINAEESQKVKVYMFEAGGCPYCEAEEEYLKSLPGYGKTFELIKKELYVDHENWEKGKDYNIGKAVAETFKAQGYKDADYKGTPFVVISDIYAAAAYSEDLEKYIDQAHAEGDKDAVSCIILGGSLECVREAASKINSKADTSKAGIVIAILGGIALIGVVVYLVTRKKDDMTDVKEDEYKYEYEDDDDVKETEDEEDEDDDNDEEYKEEYEVAYEEEYDSEKPKKIVKKTTTRKTTTRKTNSKKTSAKKTRK